MAISVQTLLQSNLPSSAYVYDLDDVSSATDGTTNAFNLTYNQVSANVTSPFLITVTVDGLVQPAFSTAYEPTIGGYVLAAQKGYTVDPDSLQLKFADTPYQGAQILVRTVSGSVNPTPKVYPFKSLDILMGY